MKLKICSFKIAKQLKDVGFDELCDECFDLNGHTYLNGWCERIDDYFDDEFCNSQIDSLHLDYITTPTLALVQMWFREEHGLLIYVKHFTQNWYEWIIQTNEVVECDGRIWGDDVTSDKNESTYDQALEVGILKAIKLIKNGSN